MFLMFSHVKTYNG